MTPTRTTRPIRPIRLAYAPMFLRVFFGLTGLFAVLVGLRLAGKVGPIQWCFGVVFYTMIFAGAAFVAAAWVTLLFGASVRLIVRPRMLSWLRPRTDEAHSAFHLEPRERELVSGPARLEQGKCWAAGRLVLTDRRLLFLPVAWDAEPLTLPISRLRRAVATPPPPAFWGMIRNVPPRLEIGVDDDFHARFAVLDAESWAQKIAPLCPTEGRPPAPLSLAPSLVASSPIEL